ncbi:MAG TPA: hypothetical protein VK154_20150 [Chitinophagales bacterium]|nr:hypothetical protein [Chitinophagales bacterium]
MAMPHQNRIIYTKPFAIALFVAFAFFIVLGIVWHKKNNLSSPSFSSPLINIALNQKTQTQYAKALTASHTQQVYFTCDEVSKLYFVPTGFGDFYSDYDLKSLVWLDSNWLVLNTSALHTASDSIYMNMLVLCPVTKQANEQMHDEFNRIRKHFELDESWLEYTYSPIEYMTGAETSDRYELDSAYFKAYLNRADSDALAVSIRPSNFYDEAIHNAINASIAKTPEKDFVIKYLSQFHSLINGKYIVLIVRHNNNRFSAFNNTVNDSEFELKLPCDNRAVPLPASDAIYIKQ